MSIVTSEIQRRTDELIAQLEAFAERHGVETFPAPDLAEQIADTMVKRSMTLDQVLDETRTAMVKIIEVRGRLPKYRVRRQSVQ